MKQKIFINIIIAVVGLFASASLANAQAPTVGPTSGDGGQLPSVICRTDAECGNDLVCRDGQCEKSIPPTILSVPVSTGGGQAPNVVCTNDADCGPGLTCYKGECYKQVSPEVFVGPTVTGQGSGSVVPSDGKCPDRYIVSDDGKNCLKIDAYSPPVQSFSPSAIGGGQTTVKPSDGKCPMEYVLSKDGGECLKPSVPTVFVPPTVAAPTVVFTSEKISVRGTATKKEISVAPTEGFKVVVDAQVPVAVEKDINGTITVSRNGISAPTTKGEVVQVEKGEITVSGEEVKVMPDTAVTIINRELKAEVQSVRLESGSTAAMYKVEATRESRILGLFRVTVPIVASVNAQTSAVEKVKKPWWSFLTF